jgi:large subunit ribosomal protein L15
MQLHQLKPIHNRKKGKRIGRGGKRGSCSGRGSYGQKSRAGRKTVPFIRQLIKKYPKLRGYRFKPKQEKPQIINLKDLERNFKQGDLVSPQILLQKKLICKTKGKLPEVKILGMGRLTKNLNIKGCSVSNTAKEKIKKAKGTVN